MDTQEQTYRNAPFWLMLGGFILVNAFPGDIDCCESFQGLFQTTSVSKEMIAKNITTLEKIRSFEFALYIYLAASIVLGISYGILNGSLMAGRISLKGGNIKELSFKGIKEFSFLIFLTLFVPSLVAFYFPEAVAQQGLKAWLLLKILLTGSAFMIGILFIFVTVATKESVAKRDGNGEKR